ncbi:flagellar FliJ family protein [Halobacteriovorax sp. RT-1-4]|uniref:flagellar FliJ family protein n=1 Tax=unclassified Halobacteriovorax TaxID=2639665 RepID=UPI00399A21DD
MRREKFKLQGLLKLREFREQKIKLELGQINIEKGRLNEAIAKCNLDIEETYKAQEAFFDTYTSGRNAQFFPMFIQSKRDEIKVLENQLHAVQRQYQEKVKELSVAKGEVKVIDNLKNEFETEQNRVIEKKRQEAIDELMMAKRHAQKLAGEA